MILHVYWRPRRTFQPLFFKQIRKYSEVIGPGEITLVKEKG